MSGGGIALKSLLDNETMILPNKINHQKYGFFYYFSNELMNETHVDNIPRYVVFIENCKYIVDPTKKMEIEYCSSIYFQNEHHFPIWCIKSSEHFVKIKN